eukprot:69372-Pyramimonas_sp.AAC.1
MKLAGITLSPACIARPVQWGPDLEVKHGVPGTRGARGPELAPMLPARAEGLKIAGRKGHVGRLVGHIES